MTPPQIIQQCIDRVRAAPDARSAAQIERRCRERLGGDRRIAAQCAAAARQIGEWMAKGEGDTAAAVHSAYMAAKSVLHIDGGRH